MEFKDIYLFAKKNLLDTIQVIFPTNCMACNAILTHYEEEICIKCRHNLPFIISKNQYQIFESETITKYSFVTQCSFLFSYEKNSKIQQLIHNFKYKKPKKLGLILSSWHYNLVKEWHFIDKINLVVVVPLHKKKLKTRGYNQLEFYAKNISKMLNAEFSSNVLLKIKETKTQSKQNRKQRFKNIKDSIILNPNINIQNKHILLIDDVVTTGATMEACLNALKNCNTIKVSIAAIGITLLN